jgi:hypothetical protein
MPREFFSQRNFVRRRRIRAAHQAEQGPASEVDEPSVKRRRLDGFEDNGDDIGDFREDCDLHNGDDIGDFHEDDDLRSPVDDDGHYDSDTVSCGGWIRRTS